MMRRSRGRRCSTRSLYPCGTMPRFPSLAHAPAETRRTLRDRFRRFLRTYGEGVEPTRGRLLRDELLLRLLLNLRVEFESDVERAKATYAAALAQNTGEPSFDEVVAAGWIRVAAGRIGTPFEVAREAMRRGTCPMTALAALLKKRFEQRFVLNDAAQNDAELAPLVAEAKAGEPTTFSLRSQDSRWVAARLWDRALSDSTDHSSELRLWVDRWRLIGAPSLIPTQAWSEHAANAFFQTAISMLEKEPSLVGWQETGTASRSSSRLAQAAPRRMWNLASLPFPSRLLIARCGLKISGSNGRSQEFLGHP